MNLLLGCLTLHVKTSPYATSVNITSQHDVTSQGKTRMFNFVVYSDAPRSMLRRPVRLPAKTFKTGCWWERGRAEYSWHLNLILKSFVCLTSICGDISARQSVSMASICHVIFPTPFVFRVNVSSSNRLRCHMSLGKALWGYHVRVILVQQPNSRLPRKATLSHYHPAPDVWSTVIQKLTVAKLLNMSPEYRYRDSAIRLAPSQLPCSLFSQLVLCLWVFRPKSVAVSQPKFRCSDTEHWVKSTTEIQTSQ